MNNNTQPFIVETLYGGVALAHNGQLTKARSLRRKLMRQGVGMFTTSDSECIIQYISRGLDDEVDGKPDWTRRIQNFLGEISGACSCIMIMSGALYAFRDRHGLRPLCIGKLKYAKSDTENCRNSGRIHLDKSSGEEELSTGWILASESCALSTIGAEFLRDVRPGEIIRIDHNGLYSTQYTPAMPVKEAFCIFEYVYFARPDSVIEGRLVHYVRQLIGKHLAQESPVPNADIVVGVPDSSTPIAIGYSNASGIPLTEGLTKNRYIARTFIQPDQSMRVANVELKYNPLPMNLIDKSVVLIDDSIVRGTTSSQLVSLIKKGGAREVHVRIGSPPVKNSCYMGVDMRTPKELIASSNTIEETRAFLGADSLSYISQSALENAVNEALGKNLSKEESSKFMHGFCNACFTGNYPLEVDPW